VLAAGLLLGARRAGWAHGTLVASNPAAGSTVARSPAALHLTFSEPLEPSLSQLSLVAIDGEVTHLHAAGDPHDVNSLVAPLDSLAPGAYRVVWRVVSADGHPVGGSFVFHVATPTPTINELVARASAMHDSAMRRSGMHDSVAQTATPPEPPDADRPAAWGPSSSGAPLVPALLRGLGVGALMALAGLLGFVGWPGAGHRRTPRAMRPLALLAVVAPLLLALHFGAWLVNAAPDHSLATALSAGALDGTIGRVEVLRIGLALLALWALTLARRSRLACLFAAAALAASGLTGHAAAVRPLLAAPAKAVHLLAAAAWIGGVLWLVLRDRADRAAYVADAARVSAVALVSIALVALSGVAETLLVVSAPADVLRSAYGAVVLAKVAGLGALALFGLHHRNRLLPQLGMGGDRLASSLRRELAVMGVVVLLGGFLAYVPTPAPPGATSSTVPLSR
jgi:copper transport protein